MQSKIIIKLVMLMLLMGIKNLNAQQVLAKAPSFTATVYDSSSAGYYFLSSSETLTMLILDNYGNTVYYRSGKNGNDFTLQPNGMMSYSNTQRFFFMDSTFTNIDSISAKNLDLPDTHELQVLPNGHFLLIGSDLVTMDLSQYFWKGQFGSATSLVKCSVIQEQDADKNVVFEWHAKDHFVFDEVDTFWLEHDPIITWTHSNAIELDDDSNLLFSSRNFNEITKINRSDSSVMWRLGGKQNQFTFVNSPVPFYAQHDIRRISNGHITLFDNGYYAPSHGCRALEFELDETNKIATQTWSYTFDSVMYSSSFGSVQRLANSNTVIDFGTSHSNDVDFVEVDSSGSKVFQLDGMTSYRVFKYPSLPFELHRPQITPFDSLGVTWLDAGAGYSSYAWNNGNTTQKIAIDTLANNYFVYVPYGQGGFISSEKFIVTGFPSMPSAITITGGTAKVCPGETRTYTVIRETGTSYNWTVPTGAAINSGQGTNNISVTYNSGFAVAGTLSVTGINSYGSSVPRTLTVNRNNPVTTITITGPTTFCSGTNPLTLTVNGGTGLTYQWKKGANNISGATSQSYVPTASSNSYKVIVTNAPGCSKTSGGVAVTVNPLPSATITPQGPTTFCMGSSVVLMANSGSGFSYQWKKGSGNILGATLQNYTATTGGTYKVTVTAQNNCAKTSAGIVLTINCRLSDESSNDASMEVFPNPTNGTVTLKFISSKNQNCNLIITDVTGREVMCEQMTAEEGVNEYFFDMCSFVKGVYLAKLKTSENEIIKKIVRN